MKHITIIIPHGQGNLSTVACIVGACEILTEANSYWKKKGKKEFHKIELAGVPGKVKYYNEYIILQPQVNISSVAKTNLIIIPSSSIRNYEKAEKG
ncbi:MAG TPA: AraC family transcriptional regulator, partial [Puia sp.]|nr:AraC family transcriptional regulator [Puia sp.]